MSIIKPGTVGLCPSCPALPQTRQWGFPAPQGPLRPAGTKAAPTWVGPCNSKGHPGPLRSHGKASLPRISWWKTKAEAGMGGCFPPG